MIQNRINKVLNSERTAALGGGAYEKAEGYFVLRSSSLPQRTKGGANS